MDLFISAFFVYHTSFTHTTNHPPHTDTLFVMLTMLTHEGVMDSASYATKIPETIQKGLCMVFYFIGLGLFGFIFANLIVATLIIKIERADRELVHKRELRTIQVRWPICLNRK